MTSNDTDRPPVTRAMQSFVQVIEPLFALAPTFAAVLEGDNHVFRYTNPRYKALVGRHNLLGMTVRQAVPEVEPQGFMAIIDAVILTGKPFVANGVPIVFTPVESATPIERVVDFVYQPIFDEHDKACGIFAHGVDVTQNKRNEFALSTLLDSSDVEEELAAWKRQQIDFLVRLDRTISHLGHPLQTDLYDLRTATVAEQAKQAADALDRQLVRLQSLIRQQVDDLAGDPTALN
jgi:hypothetical protein